jgi:hypothetical protein
MKNKKDLSYILYFLFFCVFIFSLAYFKIQPTTGHPISILKMINSNNDSINDKYKFMQDIDNPIKYNIHRTAKIFKHGSGHTVLNIFRGQYPVFLNTEEAHRIIINEFKAQSIEIDTSIHFKMINSISDPNNHNSDNYRYSFAYLPKAQVCIDYFEALPEINNADIIRDGISFNSIKRANNYRNLFIAEDKCNFVAFYEPLDFTYSLLDKKKAIPKYTSYTCKRQLTAQVRDFIVWAKSKEIIR